MWFFIRKSKAYLTVEASIVFPLLIYAVLAFVYMVIFTHDKTLLKQDTSLVAVYALEEYRNSDKHFIDELSKKYAVIKEEHPYLAISDIDMSVSKKGNKLYVESYFIFQTPLNSLVPEWFPIKDRIYSVKSEITIADPVEIMFISKDLCG